MSGEDRLTQPRGLLLIQSDRGFTRKRSKKIGAVFSLSTLFSLQEHQGLMKRTKSCFQQYCHFFPFVWNGITSHQQQKQGFTLPLLKDDECYVQRRMKTKIQIKENPIYNIYNIISENQKICLAFHPPPICNEFQAATCL